MVLDASVLIGYLDREDALHRRAETLLLEEAAEDFGVTVITLAEVLVGPAGRGTLETTLGLLRDLGVIELPLPDGASSRLAQLRSATGLKLPGCCVLLAAEHRGGAVASFDERLVVAARARGLRTAP